MDAPVPVAEAGLNLKAAPMVAAVMSVVLKVSSVIETSTNSALPSEEGMMLEPRAKTAPFALTVPRRAMIAVQVSSRPAVSAGRPDAVTLNMTVLLMGVPRKMLLKVKEPLLTADSVMLVVPKISTGATYSPVPLYALMTSVFVADSATSPLMSIAVTVSDGTIFDGATSRVHGDLVLNEITAPTAGRELRLKTSPPREFGSDT